MLIVLAVATATLVGAQAAFAAVASDISIRYKASTEHFRGKVTSADEECQAGRTVKLFEVTDTDRTLQGKTITSADGVWKLEVMHAEGHYVAKTPKEKIMHTSCGGAESRTIDVM
jgi:hypothetical protein